MYHLCDVDVHFRDIDVLALSEFAEQGGNMAFENIWHDHRLTTRYYGSLTSKDLIDANSAATGSHRYEQLDAILISFSAISDYAVDEKDVLIAVDFALRNNPYNPNVPVALVSDNPVLSALIEQYIHYTQLEIPHARQAHFQNEAGAETWLASFTTT